MAEKTVSRAGATPTPAEVTPIEQARALAGDLHHCLAYRAGAISEAAFRLAQYQHQHQAIVQMAALPGIGETLRSYGVALNEPERGDEGALPELLRELCHQMRELARGAEALERRIGGLA